MMLGDRGQPLVEEVLETEMISLDDEVPSPQVRPPVPDGLDQTDEFALVGGERAMRGAIGWLKKATGCPSWTSTAPKPVEDASHSTTNSLLKSGMARIGADDTAALSATKAAIATSSQAKPSFLRRAVKGAATVP
jgi:hypothetical protein